MRRPGLSTLFETIRVKSFRNGLVGGSRVWTAVFVARFVGRWLARAVKKGEMPVKHSERLAPGESLLIRHADPE